MTIKKALLLVGSPKGNGSNSYSLGSFLMKKLSENGVETTTMMVKDMLGSEGRIKDMLREIDITELIVLAFPLYVDSLPAMDIKLLQIISEHRSGSTDKKGFIPIVNCGFPEVHHNGTAISICRNFASRANLEWRGGLSLGGGMAIASRPLEETGGVTRNIIKSLKMAAQSLAMGEPIPKESEERMALPVAPKWIFIRVGNRWWKKQAKENGVENELNARPYADD
ncbi:MAG: NAD(P)H-dependent oxidoreductase [Methanomassiliicoccales archaeon]|nr:NAD(P)H-dependent oxidoreductase [Methanomassiliicoccales archaeon]NYT14528.1 NAD(P)H-dependent oxidoreductase [Methanomassiliicoccales archaeon]